MLISGVSSQLQSYQYLKNSRKDINSYTFKKEWQEIPQNIGADIKVLDMPMLDTTQFKDLIGNFVSNLVLEVLSFVAEQERENIKQRQSEGIAVAKAQCKHLGRPNAEYPENFKEVYLQWKSEGITAVTAMEQLAIKKTTFYKLVKQYEQG